MAVHSAPARRDAATDPTSSRGSRTPTTKTDPAPIRAADMRLVAVVIPVSDVDRAQPFYRGLGWRPDADFASGDGWYAVPFTPPGSGASVILGANLTAAAPGSARGSYRVVSDIEAARQDLRRRGVEVSQRFHGADNARTGTDEPCLFGRGRVGGGPRATQRPRARLVQSHAVRTIMSGQRVTGPRGA
ncbi:hypothetical protein M446_1362 [Methylobacterium sp. 4-46]|nr:hypothetical protein M446_1362 [Methylobacterium sp. 4-46]